MSVRAALEDLGEQLYAERDAAREECIRLRADKQALLQGHEEQRSEISRLKSQVAKLDSLRSEAAQLSHQFRNERDRLSERVAELEAELSDAKESEDALRRGVNWVASMRRATAEERDRLRAEVEVLKSALAAATDHYPSAADYIAASQGRGERGMIRRLIRSALLRAVIPALDSAILWAFGWRKEWVEGMGCGPHYVDPLNPDHLLLRDAAVAVACNRARWEAESARKAAKRAAQAKEGAE